MKQVVVRPAAAADIEEAYEWYERQRPGLGEEFLAALKSTIGYKASLVARRIYQVLPDPDARKRGLLRVIDESGEDYLFPERLFLAIELPKRAGKMFSSPPDQPLACFARSSRTVVRLSVRAQPA